MQADAEGYVGDSAYGTTDVAIELVAEAQRYSDQLHFKNFEEATDDDLRSQLADRARLEELAKKR